MFRGGKGSTSGVCETGVLKTVIPDGSSFLGWRMAAGVLLGFHLAIACFICFTGWVPRLSIKTNEVTVG